MLRSLLLAATCFLAAVTATRAQVPDWIWAKSAGGSGTDNSFSIAAHRSGSTYVTGSFSSPAITFGSTVLANSGTTDIFIARYDTAGSMLWARRAGGTGYDGSLAVATDSAGNCYLTGAFEGSATFENVTLNAVGATDLFVAKYDAAGTLLWARSAGSGMMEGGSSIAVDGAGNCYVAGYYSDDFTFGSANLTNAGYEDLFIASYDAAGALRWVRSTGGTGNDMATDITADRAGNVFLTGWYNSSSLQFGSAAVSNTGQNDVFIARYDAAGNALWAKSAGGAGSDQGLSIAADGSGNSFITGYYTNNSIAFGSVSLPNSGGQDVFIAKYDGAGNPQWARRAGGALDDLGYAIAADSNGYSYLTGWFQSSSIAFGDETLGNAGAWPYSDLFVTAFSPAGTVRWSRKAGDAGMDMANGIDLDGRGNLYLTGTFNTSIAFGTTTLNSTGADDLFVAKMSVGSLGVRQVPSAAGYALYPNPTTGRLHIRRASAAPLSQTLEAFDGSGRLLLRQEISSAETSIDLQQCPAGLYGIRIGGEWLPVVKR